MSPGSNFPFNLLVKRHLCPSPGLDWMYKAGCLAARADLVEPAGKDGEIPGSGVWLVGVWV